MMRRGDLVVRKSYGGDLLFRVEDAAQQRAILKGVEFRLLADSPLSDLVPVSDLQSHRSTAEYELRAQESTRALEMYKLRQQEKIGSIIPHMKKSRDELPFFEVPGKVLHLDGDPMYLRKSMSVYGQLHMPAEGYYVSESNMAEAVYRLLPSVKPDILVITGHDGLHKHSKVQEYNELGSYKNSMNFANAVKTARQFEQNRDSLIIIAGACQSHFEALLQSGANFASSPARILIHALDPVYIAAKVSFTSIKETVNIYDVISNTISGMDGLGGIETRGCYRIGLPKLKIKNERFVNK